MKKTLITIAIAALFFLTASCGQGQSRSGSIPLPDSLLIVPGVRAGNSVLNRDNEEERIYISNPLYRTANHMGVGSTLEELLDAYPNSTMTVEGDVSRYNFMLLEESKRFEGLDNNDNIFITCLNPDGKEAGLMFCLIFKKENDIIAIKRETKVVELHVYIPNETEISGSAMLWVSEDGSWQQPPLFPCTTAEATFSTPVSMEEAKASDPDFDGTYLFLSNPNGRYYHFRTYAGGGDSQWDGFWHYEEHFTASSSLSSSSGITYGADNLTNTVQIDDQLMGGDRRTVWCEGVSGYGIGEWVTMSIRTKGDYVGMDDRICFTQLMIVNGYAKDAATWKNNSRVKTLILYVGNEYLCDLALEDVINPQIFNLEEVGAIYPAHSGKLINLSEKEAFPNIPPSSILWKYEIAQSPIYQTDLKFVIKEVYPGDKYDDTCLTGIAVNVYTGIY